MLAMDFDGVINDIAHQFCQKMSGYLSRPFSVEEITQYDFAATLPITDEQKAEIKAFYSSAESIIESPFIPGSIEFLRHFQEISPIIIITSRAHADARALIKAKLREAGVPSPAVFCSKNKGLVSQQLQIKTFVDDYYVHLEEVARQGITPVIFDQPWNRDFNTFRRISRLSELMNG